MSDLELYFDYLSKVKEIYVRGYAITKIFKCDFKYKINYVKLN